jgi:hypothetical protein
MCMCALSGATRGRLTFRGCIFYVFLKDVRKKILILPKLSGSFRNKIRRIWGHDWETPKEVLAKHPYSGISRDFKAQNGHFPEPKSHRSGDVLGSIRNALAILVMLLHLIRDFLASFGVILLISPSFPCLEIGLFYPLRLAICRLCPAISGTLGAKSVAKGAISCLSGQCLWPFGGCRPPLSAILCGHIWPIQALRYMGFGQNRPSANSSSQIGHL